MKQAQVRSMDIAINFDYRKEDVEQLLDFERLAELVITSEKMPPNTEVSISFVTNEEIEDLNREYRGIARPTDVLSFECDGFDDEESAITAEGMAFELGDIIIAPDIAQEQAPSFGISLADEMSLLVTHGLLHLCGYDHMDDDEAQIMEQRETDLLTQFWGRPFMRSAAED